MPIYRPYAEQLLASAHAFRCFCGDPRADDPWAERAHALPSVPCGELSVEESAERAARGERYQVKLRYPAKWPWFPDLVFGGRRGHRPTPKRYEDPPRCCKERTILRPDGWPTYHFANVVDDHLMQITHVVRANVRCARSLLPVRRI